MRRVVITGLGVVSAVGCDPAAFFDALLAGRSGVARIGGGTICADVPPRVAARIDASSAPGEPASLDRFSRFARAAALQAVADAGLRLDDEDRSRIGVCFGTGLGGAQTIEDGYVALFRRGPAAVRPLSVLTAMNAAAAAQVASALRIEGPSITYSTACSSSAIAIGEAARMIRHGYVDVAVAGGAEALLTEGAMAAWDAMRTMAAVDPDDPSTSCRPFAKDRSGLVLGEGAGVVVLEAIERARQRGAAVHAELLGFGVTNDGEHPTRPSVEGQVRAMRAALADAGIGADAIDHINAHGTATIVGDRVETAAIKAVFGPRAYRIPVSATKALHGHMMGAAGAVELIAAVQAIERRALPPTAHLRQPDPDCDLDYVADGPRRHVPVGTVMSNSFAFGGSSAVLIVRAAA